MRYPTAITNTQFVSQQEVLTSVAIAGVTVQVPKETRAKLIEAGVTTGRSKVYGVSVSADGTKKFLCQLVDGHIVETVGIPEVGTGTDTKARLTACVSSQVSCQGCCRICVFIEAGVSSLPG
jgi:adenine C2-methylase RlmN of 23S rRNA A2503 and tRNA A37